MFLLRLEELKELLQKSQYTEKSTLIESDRALALAQYFFSQAKNEKGIVYFIGNGGSAGIASHFTADFLRTLHMATNTMTDPSMMSCLANDMGYEHVYSHPLDKALKKGDLLVAISSSGKSANIVNGAKMAKKHQIPLITLTGFSSENPLRALGDLNFYVPSHDYGLVESAHFFFLHTIVDSMSGAFIPKKEALNYAR